MENKYLLVGFIVLIVSVISCTTYYSNIYRPLSEESDAEVIGYIDWIGVGSLDKLNEQETYQIVYNRLLEEAKRRFTGDIDVREISFRRDLNYTPPYFAKCTVIRRNPYGNIDAALEKASKEIMDLIPSSSKIAIVYISSANQNTTDYIANEVEYIMVKEGFIIIDRVQLDRIRQEQNFQLSGEVDDETAVSVGKLVGADIIITGSITGTGSLKRLRLRALNTQTAQVMAVASEQLLGVQNADPNPENSKDFMDINELWDSSSNKSIISQNKKYELKFQSDGNLVLYKNGYKAIWSSKTDGHSKAILTLQSDGNLVIYENNHAIWSTNRFGNSAKLVVQNDGNVVIYASNKAIWATKTNGR